MTKPTMAPLLPVLAAALESLEPRLMLSASDALTGTVFSWSGWSAEPTGQQAAQLSYEFAGTPQIEQAVLGHRVTLEGEDLWAVPGDPYVPVHTSRILLPQGTTVADVAVNLGPGVQIGTGVEMLSASQPVPVGQVFEGEYALEDEAFPGGQAARWSVGQVRGYTVLDLSLFPVSYSALDGSLTYYQNLHVSLSTAEAPAGSLSVRNLQADQDVVAGLVDNDETLGDYALPAGESETPAGETAEYLIITPSSLAGAMQALADHRTSFNGYGAEVVTTEYIEANYSGLRPDGGTDLQTKIRNCIIDYYTNHGTQFVVLGGDHNLVPDRNTYVSVGSYTASDMPTDLYYAGLDGDWDGDSGNEAADGVYGEAFSGNDEGDLYPDVHVGRIAVRTSQQATDYIAKVMAYELNPPLDVAGKFLLGGKQLGDKYTGSDRPSDTMYDGHVQFQDASHPTVSDAEMWQRRAYRDYVQNDENWDGQPDSTGDFAGRSWQADELGIVTDTLTSWDTSSPGDYKIDDAGLSAAFNEGWNFLIFDTHGGNTVWASEGTYFNSSDALNLTGPTHFVYTGACHTNAFDKTTTALSEGFIRSVDGGALAYIGSSRYGWYSPDSPPASNYSDGGSSSRYQGRWLEEVFLNEQTILGDSFDLHKQHFAGSSGYNGSYRWLQFGLNLIGDPAIGILGVQPMVSITATDPLAGEGGTDSASVTIARTGSTASPLTVSYTRSGTAVYGNNQDYTTDPNTSSSGTVTIPAGASSVTIGIFTEDDSDPETEETVTLTLSASTDYTVGAASSAEVTIVDDDSTDAPTLQLAALDAEAAEADSDPARVRIWRTGSVAGDLTVNYSLGGSADAGDYTETLTGSVVLPDGSASMELDVTPVDDTLVEGEETLELALQAGAYALGTQTISVLTIAENEAPHTVTVSAIDAEAFENPADEGTFRVSRTGDASLALVVAVSLGGTASAGSDYTAIATPVTIPAGASYVDVPVTPLDDSAYESPETITLTVVDGTGYYEPGSANSATVTLADDDNAPPAVALLSPTDGLTYESGDVLTLQAEATDDFGVDRVEFYADGTLIGLGTPSGDVYSLDWTGQYGLVSLTALAVDTHGASSQTPGVSVTGTAIADGTGTGILRQWWTGVDGTSVTDLTGLASYPDSPAGEDTVTGPDGVFEFNPDPEMDNYGTRMRGWFLAPKTGQYTFYVCSDDSSQLWLSTDASPDNAVQIASVSGYANYGEWDKYASQQSSPVTLQAGQRYYIEALHKEGSGGDHVQVGVSLPGGQMERSIPYHRLLPWVDQAVLTDAISLSVPEGGSAQLGVKLSVAPGGAVDVQVARTGGDEDITVSAGLLSFDETNWDTWQYVTVYAAEDMDSEDGTAQLTASTSNWSAALVSATEADDDVNTAPTVTILDPAVAEVQLLDTASLLVLDGEVTDDGKPDGAGLVTTWSLAQGPASVVFEDASNPDTTVQFSQDGTYVLRLTADDGEYQIADEVTVKIGSAGTLAPTPELLWYTFDEGSGTQATDASGAGHDGTITDATWTDGMHGGALDFDGANDYVLDDDGELYINGLTAFTLTSWIRADATDVDMGWVVGRDPTDGDDTFGIRYDQSGAYGGGSQVIKAGISTDGGNCQIESSSYVQTTEWQFVALTWQSGASMSLYLDGSTADALTYDSGAVSGAITGATKLLVGKPPKGSDWDGLVDDVRLYNRQLSPAEIQAIFEGALPNTGPQTLAGADQQVDGAQATLAGTATDDGLPDPPASLDVQWIQLAGPGSASFTDPAATDAGVSVDQAGTYTFRLIASDGQVTTASDVEVQFAFDVTPPTVTAVDRNDCDLCCGEMTSLAFSFDENVAIGAAALSLHDADGQAIDLTAVGPEDFSYDAQTMTARWDLTDLAIPPGWYTAVLDDATVSDEAGNALDGEGDGSAGGDFHSVQLVALPGDTDCDGDVDADDATVLRDHWGQTSVTWPEGDFDGDGDTDLRDASALLEHFGQQLPDPQTPQLPQRAQRTELPGSGEMESAGELAKPTSVAPTGPTSPDTAEPLLASPRQAPLTSPVALAWAPAMVATPATPRPAASARPQTPGHAVLPQDALRWGPAYRSPNAWAASQWQGPLHHATATDAPVDLLGAAIALPALPSTPAS